MVSSKLHKKHLRIRDMSAERLERKKVVVGVVGVSLGGGNTLLISCRGGWALKGRPDGGGGDSMDGGM